MQIWAAASVVVALLAGYSLRTAFGWFFRLDREASSKAADLVLQDPTSLKKVPTPSIFDEPSKALSVIVPAYNEELRLPGTLQETIRYLQQRRDQRGALSTYELIIVDDGSSDGTAEVGYRWTKQQGFDSVRVLKLPHNMGKGYAVKAGMLAARGSLLLLMDADGATRVADLAKLEADLRKVCSNAGRGDGEYGLAVGSRAHLEKEALAKRSWARNFLMRGFHILVLVVSGGAVRDTQCGFKLFTRRAAQALFPNQRLQRWCFDVELLFLASRLRIPVAETAVTWTEIPGSKIRVTSILHMAWELLGVLVGYRWLGIWRIYTESELRSKPKSA